MDDARTKLQGWGALQRVFPAPPPCLPVQQQPNDNGKCHKAYNECGELPSYADSFDCTASWHGGTWHAVVSCCNPPAVAVADLFRGLIRTRGRKKRRRECRIFTTQTAAKAEQNPNVCVFMAWMLFQERRDGACEKELQVIRASKSPGVWASGHHQ